MKNTFIVCMRVKKGGEIINGVIITKNGIISDKIHLLVMNVEIWRGK